MDISGGLLAKNVMPIGEHIRCLTCKNVMHAAHATHKPSTTVIAREITLHPGNFYQKENPLFDEQLATYTAGSRPLFARRVELRKLSDNLQTTG